VKLEQKLKKGLRYHQLGDLEKARKTYEHILEIDPTHADAVNLLGVVAYQTGYMVQAIVLINKAIENQPECPIYYSNMALVFNDLGKPGQAISCCQKALALKEDHVAAYKNLGKAFEHPDKKDEAMSYYERALELNPEDVEIYNSIGNLRHALGKPEEAVYFYKQALVFKPDLAEAYNKLGGEYLIHHLGVPDLCRYTCTHDLDSKKCSEYPEGKSEEVQAGLKNCPKHHDMFQ
jgi:tetratricopeptide (TPR) repeat protein